MIPQNAELEGRRGPLPGPRRIAVDVARGIAVLAMVVYHTAWDLSQLDLIETDITASLAWSLFARAIAASFLALAGIGLVLAHGGSVQRRPFLRRLVVLAVAALVVTAVTRIVFPDGYIFFGILHNMAASSLIALPLVRAPIVVSALAALVVLGAPLALTAPVFDEPLLAFLGLGTRVPLTNDYVPIFPWTGFVLAGIVAARLAEPGLRAAPSHAAGRFGRTLAGIGRRSLAIYLLHQPLIFGALWAVKEVTGPNLAAEAAPFMTNCVASCRATGSTAELCRTSCTCTVDELRREGLWTIMLGGRPSPEELSRASGLARTCLERAR